MKSYLYSLDGYSNENSNEVKKSIEAIIGVELVNVNPQNRFSLASSEIKNDPNLNLVLVESDLPSDELLLSITEALKPLGINPVPTNQ